MHKLSGTKFFSKLDAKNAYWSVKLDQESQLLATFNKPFGGYCFQRMFYRLKMYSIIVKCTRVLALINDVIIYGKTREEDDQKLWKLMETTQIAGLTFNS